MIACDAESWKSIPSLDPEFVRRVRANVRMRGLFLPGNKILVAVSGGPDSVALLHLLHELQSEWNLALSVIHVNYGLRGKESNEDARFVRQLCGRLAVPFVVRRVDMSQCAKGLEGQSIQERAREIRYRIMKDVAAEERADKVALGHTADDQAETILLWLLRGAGLTGLAGMPAVREGLFIRPLLTMTRAELAVYLTSRAIEFRVDSTNAKPLYRRNRIRHELVPAITALAPSFVKVMGRQSEVLGEEDRFLEQLVSDWLPRVLSEDGSRPVLNRPAVLEAPLALQRRLVRRILRGLNPRGVASRFSFVDAILRQVVRGSSGVRLAAGGIAVVRDGTAIRFMRQEPPASGGRFYATNELSLGIPGGIVWPGTGERIDLQPVEKERARTLMQSVSKRIAVFDASTFTAPLVVRHWQYGDRFAPAGMAGKQKKLQDFFTDSKVSRIDRQRIPLLAAPEGILWVAGHRADQRFLARSSTTAFVMASISSDVSTEGRD